MVVVPYRGDVKTTLRGGKALPGVETDPIVQVPIDGPVSYVGIPGRRNPRTDKSCYLV